MKKYTVISNRDIDVSEIDSQLQVETLSLSSIPDRAASIAKAHPESKRVTSWYLTDEEAEQLKNDPRVLDVVTEPKATPVSYSEQKSNFFRQPNTNVTTTNQLHTRRSPKSYPDPTGTHVNWGLERCSNPGARDYNYWRELDEDGNRRDGPGTILEDKHLLGVNFQTIHHGVSGKGVDIVIMDQGVQANHPEFLDDDGNSRVQQINWYDYSDTINGTLPERFYGKGQFHGTHVASTAAGRKNGWAKEAHIYVMNILGQSSARINDINEAFELMLAWHRAKTDPTSPHYTGRPTVINMSWGWSTTSMGLPHPERVVFRGVEYDWSDFLHTNYSTANFAEWYDRFGIAHPDVGVTYNLSYQEPVTDAFVQELIDAGCTVCIAAGNRADINVNDPNDQDYDNRIIYDADSGFDDVFYMRPGSPYSDDALFVANLSNTCPQYWFPSNPGWEEFNPNSTRGSVIDIIAPGSKIRAASEPYTAYNYPIITETFTARHFNDINNPDSLYTEQSLSGTSMASPQVAGVAALHLSQKPNLTPAQVKARILEDAEELPHLHMFAFTRHTTNAPDYTPTHFGRGYESSADMPCGTTNKLLSSRYAKKPIEFKGDFNLNSVTAQGTAPVAYETFSTITVTNPSVKAFSGFRREVIVQIKSDATTNVTESIGNVKLSAQHGKFEQVKDNLDGTYTAQYIPKNSQGSSTDTITAQFRAHGTPSYKTLTSTATITLLPGTFKTHSTISAVDKTTSYPYLTYRYNNTDTAVQTDIDFKDSEEDGVFVLPHGSMGRFDVSDTTLAYTGDAILRPKSPLVLSKSLIDWNYGKYRYWARMPATTGNTNQTIQFKDDNTGLYEDMFNNEINVLEYHPWHETSVLEVWPPVAPADGVAIQEVRLIPKTSDGSSQITYTGPWYPVRLKDGGTWGDAVREANSRKAYFQEDYLKQDSYLQKSTVIHRQDFVSSEACSGDYGIRTWTIVGAGPDTPDYPYLNTAPGEFRDHIDVTRAYYSEITEVNQEGQAINAKTYQLALKQSSTTDDNATVTVRFYNPTTQEFVTATKTGDNLYQATLTFVEDGRYEIEAQVNGIYCKQRPVFTSSGTDFGLNSVLTVSPAQINGTKTAVITLQARGSAGVNSGTSAGPVNFSANKGTITNVVDNQDGTYTATYNPPLENIGQEGIEAIISASFDLYGAVTDTASITIGQAFWHLYATLTSEASSISSNGSTQITLTIRRANGNSLGTSLGDVINFTTTAGVLGPITDVGNGTYRVTLDAAGQDSGSTTINASIFGLETANPITIDFEAALDFSTHSLLTTDKTVVQGDGSDVATLSLQLRGAEGVNYTSSLGELTVSASIGDLHFDPYPGYGVDKEGIVGYRGNGRYEFYYRPIVSLAEGSQPVTITMTLGDTVITRASFMQLSGITDTNVSYSFTSGTQNNRVGVRLGDFNHYLYSHPNVYDLATLGIPVRHGTWDQSVKMAAAVPMGRFIAHHWRGSDFILEINTKNDYHIQPDDFSSSLGWQVITQTCGQPGDNDYETLSLFRTDASLTNAAANTPTWKWAVDQLIPSWDESNELPYNTTGKTWNVSLTQDAPINTAYAAFSEVTVSDSTINGNGLASSTITVTLKTSATNFATVSGGTLSLSSNIGSISAVTDNQNGTYTATFTSLAEGTAVISATINDVLIHDTATVTVVEGGSNQFTANSEVSIVDNVFDVVDRNVLTTLVGQQAVGTNVARNPQFNYTVSQLNSQGYQFADVNGTGTVTSSDTLLVMQSTSRGDDAGVDELMDRLATGYETLTQYTQYDTENNALDPLFTSHPNPKVVYADGMSYTYITLQLKDQNGNNVNTSRGTVVFTGDGTFGDVTDNQDGTYTVKYTAPVQRDGGGSTMADYQYATDTIRAYIDDALITQTLSIGLLTPRWQRGTFPEGIPATVNIGGGTFTFRILLHRIDGARATNSLGAPGDVLSFAPYTGDYTAEQLPTIDGGTDLNNGTYEFTFTSGTLAGTYTITPLIFGDLIYDFLAYSVQVTSNAAAFAEFAEITASPSTIDVNSTSTITVQAKDANGNNLSSSIGTVVLSSTGSGTLGGVTDHLDGTYTAVYTSPAAGSSVSTITATIDGFAVTDDAEITVQSTTFAEQLTVTVGEFTGFADPWYGMAYDSSNGSYIFGSADSNGYAPISGHHINQLLYFNHSGNQGTTIQISNQQVGGAITETPSNTSTSFTTVRVHNTTLNRTDASAYGLSIGDTTYGYGFNWLNTGNVFATTTTGTQRVVTFDPVD